MKKLIFISLLFSCLISFGQEIKTIHYDSLNNKSTIDLGFKKVVYEKIDSKFKLTTFEKGIKTSEKIIADTVSFTKDMKETLFYENGKIAKKTTFLKYEIIGDVETFYENGNKKAISYYQKIDNKNKEYIKSFWLIDGTQTVLNGNGIYEYNINTKKDDSKILIKGEVKNGVFEGKWNTSKNVLPYFEEYYSQGNLISGTRKNSNEETINYTEVEKEAKPKNGIESFRLEIAKKLGERIGQKINTEIRINMIVEYIVNINGQITNIQIIKQNGSNNQINEIIIKTLEEYSNNYWSPAEDRGIKIDHKYKLPLKFQIN